MDCQITAEDIEYARERTRATYNALISTPNSFREVIYAWRERGEIRVSSGIGIGSPPNCCQGVDYLTFEEQQKVRRAEEEISSRNAPEFRDLKARAIGDLIKKEFA